MKSRIIFLIAIVVLASCSAPKYTYYFDHQNNRAGKNTSQPVVETRVLSVDPQMLVATTLEEPVLFSEAAKLETPAKKTDKVERKTLRHHLKKEAKTFVADRKKLGSVESIKGAQGMDHDLKLAAIFGAVGITGLLIASVSDVFLIIGGLALLIGVVFFVKWIIRQ